MAGIALYGDLREALEGASNVLVPQRLESVKILPPRGKNPYELYGFLTQQAVYLSEIGNPEAARVFCLAVTSSEYNTPDGAPTSWSGAIDSVTSAADKEGAKRLFFISAGRLDGGAAHGGVSQGLARDDTCSYCSLCELDAEDEESVLRRGYENQGTQRPVKGLRLRCPRS